MLLGSDHVVPLDAQANIWEAPSAKLLGFDVLLSWYHIILVNMQVNIWEALSVALEMTRQIT